MRRQREGDRLYLMGSPRAETALRLLSATMPIRTAVSAAREAQEFFHRRPVPIPSNACQRRGVSRPGKPVMCLSSIADVSTAASPIRCGIGSSALSLVLMSNCSPARRSRVRTVPGNQQALFDHGSAETRRQPPRRPTGGVGVISDGMIVAVSFRGPPHRSPQRASTRIPLHDGGHSRPCRRKSTPHR
jgi:hypothetical protein